MNEDGNSHIAGLQVRARKKEELSLLGERLAVIEEKARLVTDPNFTRETIPALFKRPYDENFISDYLAYILDPSRNGIGTEPLQALLSLAFDNASDMDLDNAIIDREYTFEDNSLGRIDLLIKLGDLGESGVIGVENKIYAREEGNQTRAYARGFKQDFQNLDHYLIFLTPDGRQPASKEFNSVSYIQLFQELREIRYPILSDIHKCVIWEDFLAHIEEYIVMTEGKLELSGRTRLYLEHRQVLEALSNAFAQDSQKVYDYVTAGIRNCFGEGWNFVFKGRYSYQEINRTAWKVDNFYLFYQYRFSRDNLLVKDQFPCMLGAYPGKYADNFMKWFKANHPQIPEFCQSHDMEAYPKKREEKNSLLIAYKIYPLDNDDITKMEQQFVLAAEEFRESIPIIDESIRAYRQLISTG